ncbi:MAG: triosephosphate isomerase [Pseudomonadales bacterium]|nr:triosephosphate isomerase [Pseudomonadales bacterium]
MNKLILANFKSNKSITETNLWFENFLTNVNKVSLDKNEVSVAPSLISLSSASNTIAEFDKKISLSLQDISPFPAGSYTGAVSGQNINGLKIKYAILGHSERRKYFKEDSRDVVMKVEQCLQYNITPVLCIDDEYLDEQINLIGSENMKKCVVAYEPVSAIGTGKNVDLGRVKEIMSRVKQLAGDVKVIYGGSVNEANVNEYLLVADGVLISSASLDPQRLIKIIEAFS